MELAKRPGPIPRNKKGAETGPLSTLTGRRPLRADRDRGRRQADAERDQDQGDDAVENAFETGQTSERHDTHLSSWNPRGSEGFSNLNTAKITAI